MNEKLTYDEYRVLVERSPMLIWRSNTTGECDYFNEGWLSFTGRTIEQERGNGWAEGVHPDDLKRCVDTYFAHFHARKPFEMEYRLRRRDGVFRWIVDRGAPFFGGDGVFKGYIGNCIDIHEQVEARELLKRVHEDELRTLRGLLPICAHCKRIRDEHGNWHSVEQYIKERSQANFTHGICPECNRKLYRGK